jgi:murein L,D-transpeptidase YafK
LRCTPDMELLLLLLLSSNNPAPPTRCRAGETAVLVRVSAHALDLCQDGRSLRSHRVALGAGGTGKRVQGDGKTPLGLYQLGAPRPSPSFGTFVPVGYPTPAQHKLGFTGSAVGIHGPPRGGGGALSTTVDWTAGCIAVGTDAEIESISAWIRTRRVRAVRIE